jgi:transcriptional regulator with XRE-family HTH domain
MSLQLEFTLTDRLAKARRAHGWTQQQLADRLGINRRTVVRLEDGSGKVTKAMLIAWAVVTGVPLEWLETGTITATDTEAVTERYIQPRPYDLPLFAYPAAA